MLCLYVLETFLNLLCLVLFHLFVASRKPIETQKRDVPSYKKPNLNHTEYAYREAVNRLKSMLADSYSAVRTSNRRYGYESDVADSASVRISIFLFLKISFPRIFSIFFGLSSNSVLKPLFAFWSFH